MKFHAKRRYMESIKHLDTYVVLFSIIYIAATFVQGLRASKFWMCCNLENI